MDRNTLLAVILSTVVLVAGFFIQTVLFAPDEEVVATTNVAPTNELPQGVTEDAGTTGGVDNSSARSGASAGFTVVDFEGTKVAPVQQQLVYEQKDFVRVVMDTRGGNITEVYLLSHDDNGDPLNFFFADAEKKGLTLNLGGVDGLPLNPVFYYRRTTNENEYEFYQDIVVPGQDEAFQIIKRYRFFRDEYLFEVEIELRNSINQYIPLNFTGQAYTLSVGPQIGPEFTVLTNNGRTDFRKFSYFDGRKRKDIRNLNNGERQIVEGFTPWGAVNGKYFVAAAIPGNTGAEIVFGTSPTIGGIQGNQMHLVRPEIQSSLVTDKYRFYFGPKSSSILKRYTEAADNSLGIVETNLDALIESSWLGWLENILKAVMNVFYGWIPNWGVAIILLTILVKLILYPLTRKSYESTAKMKEMAPKISVLKEKFKDDAQKLNQATMELYKKEKVNPLGGCLPILLQFPFFIAMFSLFNNNFDLRGATFIPGWITDLSVPESVWNFGITIPLLNWDALRLLPIIFLLTQLLMTKLTQPPDSTQSSAQMKLMTLGMPIIFFFIMYNMPAGLLVYWIFQNVISTGQQLAYNYFTHKKAGSKRGASQ